MRLVITFLKRYPLQSFLTLFALLFAGLAEGFGLSILLPLLSVATQAVPGGGAAARIPGSQLERMLLDVFQWVRVPPTVGAMLAVFVLSILLKAGLVLVANKRVGYMVAQVATDLRLALIRALFASRWEYYVHQPVGRFTNAFATEAGRSADAFLFGIRVLALLLHTVVYAVVALLLDWEATLVALGAGSVLIWALHRLVTAARKAGRRQTRLLKSLLSLLTDTLQSIKPLKSMARENVADEVLQNRTRRLNSALRKQVFSKETLRALQEPLLMVFFAIGLYLALTWWHFALNAVLVMVLILAKVLKTLQKVQKEYQAMVIAESAYWSLHARIEAIRAEREEGSGTRPPALERAIRFENVGFAYDDKRPVLKGVDLLFPRGSFTAIIGPSGAGKTTVIDLVTGLLTPREGTVWVDDADLKTLDQRAWRRMIGYVPQETLLLHDTVLVNVTLGDSAFSEKDAEKALRRAGAWEFVERMPGGMHAVVGERGGRLSGGQKQRITIARALVHDPGLLILDEATSALDPSSEREICDTLTRLKGRLTILAISHQNALLNAADRAYRLEGGIVGDR